jgi:quaternary ammonium compound-resistance protein SugE
MTAWILLVIAGVFECRWAIGLKYTEGFTRLWPSLFTVASMAISIFLLSRALREIPLGTAYAVWTGIGAAGVAVLGIALFGESRDVARLLCILLIVAGVVGLKLFGSPTVPQ